MIISRVIYNTFCCDIDNGDMLKEVIVKIGLESINIGRSDSGSVVE